MQAYSYLVDRISSAGCGILILLVDHGRALGHGLRFRRDAGSLELCDRSLVVSGLADLVCHRSLDRVCTQKRQTGRCAHYAYIPSHPRFDTNYRGCKFLCLAFHSAFKMCVMIVAPEPPIFCAMPILAPST